MQLLMNVIFSGTLWVQKYECVIIQLIMVKAILSGTLFYKMLGGENDEKIYPCFICFS